jgi:hypothetical protein
MLRDSIQGIRSKIFFLIEKEEIEPASNIQEYLSSQAIGVGCNCFVPSIQEINSHIENYINFDGVGKELEKFILTEWMMD